MGMAPPSACRLTAADSLLSACPIFYVKWQREFFSRNSGQGVARLGVACLRAKEKNTYSLMMCIFIGIAIVRSWSTLKAKCQFHCGSQGIKEDTRCTMLRFHKISAFPFQFFIQLFIKPHFGTRILLFGLFGQLRVVLCTIY